MRRRRPIYDIQGTGAQSPLVGRLVRTSGVVTRINNNGFFIQDLTGDANPATSDGIFVFANPATYPAVAVGSLVGVTANVTEFNTGALPSAASPTPTLTELTSVASASQIGSGYAIAPTLVTLPQSFEGELERYKGMLVRLSGPFTVGQNFFQGRFGQLTLGFNGRLETPTNRHRPGPMAQALADENARRRIILDDGSSQQNPNPTPFLDVTTALPRAGDSFTAVHPTDGADSRFGLQSDRHVAIRSDGWFGGRPHRLPCATIADGSVIGAGTIVTLDVPTGARCRLHACDASAGGGGQRRGLRVLLRAV